MKKEISIKEVSKMLDKAIEKETKTLKDNLLKKNVWSKTKWKSIQTTWKVYS